MSAAERIIAELPVDPRPEPVVDNLLDDTLEPPIWAHRMLDGATWLRSGSETIEPLWGDSETILAAKLQPLVLAAASGAGKTTLTQRAALGAIGVPGFETLLGYPIAPTTGRVLYLAADRPDQARLSMLRMVNNDRAWDLVADRLVVMAGPPPEDVASNPSILLKMARYADATMVIPDSLKDMAIKLSDDSVGARVNQSFQHLIADKRDVWVPHHVRKVGRQDSERGITIDDLYGSVWIFNGAGSVIHLEAGPVDVELRQLKTPNGNAASMRFSLNAEGEALVGAGDPILAAVISAGDAGISTAFVAACAFHKDKPSEAEVEKVRRRLKILEGLSMVTSTGAGRAARWVAS